MLTTDLQSRLDAYVASLNQHDLQAFQACYAKDCSVTIPEDPRPLNGHDAVAKDFEKTLAAFPDMKYTVKNAMIGGDMIAVELIGSGRHRATILEVPIAVFQTLNDEGLIIEERRYYDMAAIEQALGQAAA